MRLVAPTGGWAVGDGGLVLTTHDLGRSWQTPPTDLPAIGRRQFRFPRRRSAGYARLGRRLARHAHFPLARRRPNLGIDRHRPNGAAPRTHHSSTPQHGWAVGELGNILATHDGGHSWHAQRSGGQRAALLAIFAEPTDVPLELLADSGAADGYIAAVDILCTPSRDRG